jgi:hypothetical protein
MTNEMFVVICFQNCIFDILNTPKLTVCTNGLFQFGCQFRGKQFLEFCPQPSVLTTERGYAVNEKQRIGFYSVVSSEIFAFLGEMRIQRLTEQQALIVHREQVGHEFHSRLHAKSVRQF